MTQIKIHLQKYDLDVRKTRDARFMDQKVTPDVLCVIADCVIQFIGNDTAKEFTTSDIWNSVYANENIKDIFNKPDVLVKSAQSEYDKFFAQPLKMLSYGQILKCQKRGQKNIFTVQNYGLLFYISIKERNALNFLVEYLEKVLCDSNIWIYFDNFFKNNDKDHFKILKSKYENFIRDYTSIKGVYEPRRIFTKIINPLSYIKKVRGTKRGSLSMDVITFDELMYNRRNWRDVKKHKGETRESYEKRAMLTVQQSKNSFVKFTIQKAKRLIKIRNNDLSEVKDSFSNGQATQVHHIFPRSEFPQIAAYLENLILLTATQHFTMAHLNNNTKEINKDYQLLCLLSKSESIESSLNEADEFYSKEDFVFVLNEGINPKNKFDLTASFDQIKVKISDEYNQ